MKNIKKDLMRKIFSGILLAFILISIGFLLGKYSVIHDQIDVNNKAEGSYIAVYYLHSTFRCETCNTIESMTKSLLFGKYSGEIKDGSIQWQEDDFIKNTDIAIQFNVSASCVVVAQIVDGTVSDFKRLDDVWTLMKDPQAFNEYISNAIDSYLPPRENK